MAAAGDHRRVPPADLLIAATAERAATPLIHYDRDYDRIAAVTAQPHLWFVTDGALYYPVIDSLKQGYFGTPLYNAAVQAINETGAKADYLQISVCFGPHIGAGA